MEKSLIKSSASEWDRLKSLAEHCLPPDFYRGNTVDVAQALLGKILIVRTLPEQAPSNLAEASQWVDPYWHHPAAQITAGRIVETEAYRADDPASHSRRGPTPRSQIMFGEPGVAYVYLIYGIYEMLNFVTEPVDCAGAVLIRALEPVSGEEFMFQRRHKKSPPAAQLEQALSHAQLKSLTNGPGRLCQAMGISRAHNGQSLGGPKLFVCDDGYRPSAIEHSPRIGITQGTEKLWRFFISKNAFVSLPNVGTPIRGSTNPTAELDSAVAINPDAVENTKTAAR